MNKSNNEENVISSQKNFYKLTDHTGQHTGDETWDAAGLGANAGSSVVHNVPSNHVSR